MNKNFNLNEKINFYYNKCYDTKVKPFSNSSSVNDNKVTSNNDLFNLSGGGEDTYKLDLSHDINSKDIINQISKGKFKMVKKNKDNSIVIKRYSDNLPVNLYIDKVTNESENELKVSKQLSELVFSSKTKHILLPIVNLNLNYKNLTKIFKHNNNNEIAEVLESYKKNNNFNISIKENFFKGGYLKEFLNKTKLDKNVNKKLLFHLIAVVNLHQL